MRLQSNCSSRLPGTQLHVPPRLQGAPIRYVDPSFTHVPHPLPVHMKISAQLTGDKAVRAELQRIGGLSTKAVAATAVQVEDYIEAEAGKHTKTGAIVQSIFKRSLPGGGWELGHDLQRAPQALWVHLGHPPPRDQAQEQEGAAVGRQRGVQLRQEGPPPRLQGRRLDGPRCRPGPAHL